jgi:hypothetical protein
VPQDDLVDASQDAFDWVQFFDALQVRIDPTAMRSHAAMVWTGPQVRDVLNSTAAPHIVLEQVRTTRPKRRRAAAPRRSPRRETCSGAGRAVPCRGHRQALIGPQCTAASGWLTDSRAERIGAERRLNLPIILPAGAGAAFGH